MDLDMYIKGYDDDNDDADPLANTSDDSSDFPNLFINNKIAFLKTQGTNMCVGGSSESGRHGPHVTQLSLGQRFHSISDVFHTVRRYESAHRIHLLHKYFRKIAANPKPSNKEDNMLTKEERMRFLYRWVDFCCTHYDQSHVDVGRDKLPSSSPHSSFTVKECPMRIRFELRPLEKIMTVSLFRETHDHELPNFEDSCKNGTDERGGNNSRTTHIKLPHQSKIPPPLARISNNLKQQKSQLEGSSKANYCWPRPPPPPPLKKVIITRTGDICNASIPANGQCNVEGLSADSIIKNMHSYLHTKLSKGLHKRDGIMFTTPNPNLIKLIADMTGITQSKVSQTINHTSDQSHAFSSVRISSPTEARQSPNATSGHRQLRTSIRVSSLGSFGKTRNIRGIHRSIIKTRQKTCPPQLIRKRDMVSQPDPDSDDHTLLIPHVIIKTEPHDYYENDS